MLDSNSCIYSCGVGWDVDFEKAIFNLFGSSSYLFDPTPESQNYINRYHSQSSYINFEAIGVWDKDETLDFYEPKRGGSSTVSLMTEKTHNYLFKAPCLKISSIMKRLNHSHIDLLKLDIEGAATRVLNQCFLDGVFPDTIVAEFEYNLNSENQCVQSVEEVNNTLEKAQEHGYKVFRLPRKDRRYLCIEVLLLR